jgi:hypothetical protein
VGRQVYLLTTIGQTFLPRFRILWPDPLVAAFSFSASFYDFSHLFTARFMYNLIFTESKEDK